MTATPTTSTTSAMPAAGHPTVRQLHWLVRLHRPAVLVWGLFVLVTAAALVWLGGPLTDAAATALKTESCFKDCSYDPDAPDRYRAVHSYTMYAVLAAPLLVAAWAGGSLTSRELESGTARLAWTQGVSPARWLTVRLALPALLVATGTGLLAWLHRRAWTAGANRVSSGELWYYFRDFYANGVVPVALALAGLAAGALAGLLLHRSLAALTAAVVAVGALWAAVHTTLPYLWPTITQITSLQEGAAVVGISTGKGVLTADSDRRTTHCRTILDGCDRLLGDLGAVHYFNDYHPASHYWPLQLVASGILLVVTALCVLATFRLLRHHTGRVPGKAERS
ncbi:ABC transporter permease [Streptomyces coelicoflavus]|uniref:ABC transporter permease n=1 Tax=Streptomyces coelicoflavus TaxID=285562 RepID=UPI003646A023